MRTQACWGVLALRARKLPEAREARDAAVVHLFGIGGDEVDKGRVGQRKKAVPVSAMQDMPAGLATVFLDGSLVLATDRRAKFQFVGAMELGHFVAPVPALAV